MIANGGMKSLEWCGEWNGGQWNGGQWNGMDNRPQLFKERMTLSSGYRYAADKMYSN